MVTFDLSNAEFDLFLKIEALRHKMRFHMVLEYTSYRDFLRDELAERISRNPAYSLRAMALQLGITGSSLCEVLKGRHHFSTERAGEIAESMGLDPQEAQYFILLVQHERAKKEDARQRLAERIEGIRAQRKSSVDLSLDHFRMISDWYHYGIRALTELEGFRFTPANVARKLGITIIEAEAAIDRLLKLELLEPEPGRPGRYRKAKGNLKAQSVAPNVALRKYHRQLLEKALESIEGQEPGQRLLQTQVLALSPEDLPEADRLTDEYFAQIAALSKKSRRKTEVYCLGSQLFRVSREGK
jgi:uncharacterized protein (TIGR02147 family)